MTLLERVQRISCFRRGEIEDPTHIYKPTLEISWYEHDEILHFTMTRVKGTGIEFTGEFSGPVYGQNNTFETALEEAVTACEKHLGLS